MKKAFLMFSLIFVLVLTSCGPAAESRDSMKRRAKEVQDSIANAIKTAIDDVSATQPNAVVVKDTTQKKPQ